MIIDPNIKKKCLLTELGIYWSFGIFQWSSLPNMPTHYNSLVWFLGIDKYIGSYFYFTWYCSYDKFPEVNNLSFIFLTRKSRLVRLLTDFYDWQQMQIVLKQIHSEVGYFSKDEDGLQFEAEAMLISTHLVSFWNRHSSSEVFIF